VPDDSRMTPESPLLDLLVVGGLTVDRFADGSTAPGGTVMHVARASAARGLAVGILTTSGEEPEARAGLAELGRLARVVERRPGDHSATFHHRESGEGRRLWLERRGGLVDVDPGARGRIWTTSILFAPVLAEIPLSAFQVWGDTWYRGATLQGWLRSTDEGAEVRPLPLSAIEPGIVDGLRRFNLLVASREDLLAEAADPNDQLTALRRLVGRPPTLIVTDGAAGLWLDMPLGGPRRSLRRHFAVPWRVEASSTVGAGDILAAFLTIEPDEAGLRTDLWIERAMRVVAEVLEGRRPQG
jgi:hypothetical protein